MHSDYVWTYEEGLRSGDGAEELRNEGLNNSSTTRVYMCRSLILQTDHNRIQIHCSLHWLYTPYHTINFLFLLTVLRTITHQNSITSKLFHIIIINPTSIRHRMAASLRLHSHSYRPFPLSLRRRSYRSRKLTCRIKSLGFRWDSIEQMVGNFEMTTARWIWKLYNWKIFSLRFKFSNIYCTWC